ncbi:MAG: diaminopimelate decarboxylase, partial [Bacteroidales bacterium]|nr:diaminopimelate decarboxylase [Bacteroidales bacterium]
MITKETVEKFREIQTPFYYYDLDNLHSVCRTVKEGSERTGIKVHYAIKANANPRLLSIIASYGFGADCVSFNEIRCAVSSGFKPSEVVFAGVGKTDKDIANALDTGILCFNCESIQEIEVIDLIAGQKGKTADIALRINPYVEAHT